MDSLSSEAIAFLQWLVNQGASLALALIILWRLDQRLATLADTTAKLAESQRTLLDWLSRHNGTPVSTP